MKALTRDALIRQALALTDQLRQYKTPGTSEPVDPSIPAQLLRYLQTRPTLAELDAFLAALPSSSVGTLTRSSGPQTQELVRRVRPLAQDLARHAPEAEAVEGLTYILGWTRRMLVANERGVSMASDRRT